jgi:molybdopterin/thiamine biosynthesis adenylyltransferase
VTDEQLLRYSRHILLSEFGVEAQEKLLAASALVVGAGGLGSPAALYLAAAGVGTLTLADGDTVDLTNLQRQILHTTQSVGTSKAESGKAALARINPEVRVAAVSRRLAGEELDRLVAQATIVLDCSDNFETRHAINRACVRHRTPLVSGAAVRFDGQVSVFDLRDRTSPCYHCLFPEDAEIEEMRCAVMGIFAPLTGVVGTIQAAEALKLVTGIGETLKGRLLIIDALSMEWRSVKLERDPACPVCSTSAATTACPSFPSAGA